MIFTFPAIVSSNVDERLLPGLLRTLEKYYLMHIISAVSNYAIKFVIDEAEGMPSGITIESENIGLKSLLLEASMPPGYREFPPLTGTEAAFYNNPSIKKKEFGVNKNGEPIPVIATPYEIKTISATVPNADKQTNYWWLSNIHNIREQPVPTGYIKGTNGAILDSGDAGTYKTLYQNVVHSHLNPAVKAAPYDPKDKFKSKMELSKTKRDSEKSKYEALKTKREYERGKSQDEIGKGVKVFTLNIENKLDFVPTMVVIEVDVFRRLHGKSTLRSEPLQRSIPIGVKVIPVISKNFANMYRTLRDDYFASQYRYMYKTLGRSVLRSLWSGANISKLKRWYEIAMGTNSPDELGSSKLDWYMNVLLSKKALIDGGGFNPVPGGLKYRQFASGIAVMNKDEKEDMFSEPGRLQRLFNMGWNSFVIIDNTQHTATFCSNLDRGKCEKIPISNIYHAMEAETIYKNYEDLQRSAGGFMRNIHASPLTMKQVLT